MAYHEDDIRRIFNVTITLPMIQRVVNSVGGDNYKINAIKEMKERYGMGLREAKQLVELVIRKQYVYTQVIEVTRTVTAYTEDEAWDDQPELGHVTSVRKVY